MLGCMKRFDRMAVLEGVDCLLGGVEGAIGVEETLTSLHIEV